MASTYSKITVVPPVADGVGVVPVAVSIKAPNGLTATAYTSRDDGLRLHVIGPRLDGVPVVGVGRRV